MKQRSKFILMKHESSHQPRKRFGQNFLKDEQVIYNIVSSLNLQPDDRVVEIGPGLGALTKPLLKELNRLQVIELDRDLAEKLSAFAKVQGITPKLIIHQADALKFDYGQLMNPEQGTSETNAETKTPKQKLRLLGNLPYNISTPLIFHLLKFCPIIQDMHFMLQQELVDRIAAAPNNKNYGKLTVMLQYACKATQLFSVPKEAFYPAPKVQSAVIRLVPYASPPYPAKNLELLREVTGAAFNQRRKTLANSLKNYLSKEDFIHLDIDPIARPEQLSVEQFVRIANNVEVKA